MNIVDYAVAVQDEKLAALRAQALLAAVELFIGQVWPLQAQFEGWSVELVRGEK